MKNVELIKHLLTLPLEDEVEFIHNPDIVNPSGISYGLEVFDGKLHMTGVNIDVEKARKQFQDKTGETPEEYLEHSSQDSSGKELYLYYEASFLRNDVKAHL